MKIEDELIKYLRGEKFSNGYRIELKKKYKPKSRIKLLTEICSDKNVVHVGCLDHLPLIDEKIVKNQWLHKLLTEESNKCLGIDINKDGIDFVKQKFSYNNIIYGDVTETETLKEISNEYWDYMVLGEVLEHIDNPVDFLSKIKENYHGNIKQIIITVPNVLTLNSLRLGKKGFETINTDHRYWFTPYTILKVAYQAGLEPQKILFANRIKLNFQELVVKKLHKIFLNEQPNYPFIYFNSIILTADL